MKFKTWEVVELNDNVQSQFHVTESDIYSADQFQFSQAALIAVLIELEFGHPGVLAFIVRLMALAADGWQFKAKSSNPSRSREVQAELISLLTEIDKNLSQQGRKGGTL